MQEPLVLTAYGNEIGQDKGIVIINNKQKNVLPIDGKANICIQDNNILYVPVKEKEANYIYIYHEFNNLLTLVGKYYVNHFYSYGFKKDDNLFLASFEDGVDAIFNLASYKEISIFTHTPNNYAQKGQSHYIGFNKKENVYFSVDNALQEVYLLQVDNHRLKLKYRKKFKNENIRLISYSSYSNKYYMNTEISNKIYVLDIKNNKIIIENEYSLTYNQGAFSGGNAISKDGKRLCITLRGSNILLYYEIHQDGTLSLLSKISCGQMPRDAMFKESNLYITCTLSNNIEVYKEVNKRLVKEQSISVENPITFSLING